MPASFIPTQMRPRVSTSTVRVTSLASDPGSLGSCRKRVKLSVARFQRASPASLIAIHRSWCASSTISRMKLPGSPSRGGARIGVPIELQAVVADQAVLGGEPDESLGILQAVIDRTLRQPFGGREMLEDERRCVSGLTGRYDEQ